MEFQRVGVKTGGVNDEILQVIPGDRGVRLQADVALGEHFPLEEVARIGEEGAVDESEADMVLVEGDLGDAGADGSAELFEVVVKAAVRAGLGNPGSYFGDDVAELEDDILEVPGQVLEDTLHGARRKHESIIYGKENEGKDWNADFHGSNGSTRINTKEFTTKETKKRADHRSAPTALLIRCYATRSYGPPSFASLRNASRSPK